MATEKQQEIERLKACLANEQKNLKLAAELGNKLLEANSQLSTHLDKANEYATGKIEVGLCTVNWFGQFKF